jgi:hypothetical protein
MKEKKAIKAVCLPLAVALASSPVIEAVTVDNPHVELTQYEEEPQMTFDSPYTTTSAVVSNFPWFPDGLESVPVPVLRDVKK